MQLEHASLPLYSIALPQYCLEKLLSSDASHAYAHYSIHQERHLTSLTILKNYPFSSQNFYNLYNEDSTLKPVYHTISIDLHWLVTQSSAYQFSSPFYLRSIVYRKFFL